MIKYKIELQPSPDDFDDELKFKRMIKADDAFAALYDIKSELRRIWKYEENLSEETFNKVEEIRESFFDILNNNGINLDIDFAWNKK